MNDFTMIDGQTTLAKPPKRRPSAWVVVAIVACVVISCGVVAGIALTFASPRPSSSTSAAAGTGEGDVSAFGDSRTRGSSCLDGDENAPCVDGEGYGPPLPTSLQGQPYTCLRMADTSECVVIFVHHPATGRCTEFDYIAPQAPRTEDGWRQGEDAAEYQCDS